MSQTGRAALLLALGHGREAELVIEDDGRNRWAYRLSVDGPDPIRPPPPPPLPPPPPPPPPPGPPGTAAFRLPLRMPDAWVMEPLTSRDVEAEVRATPLLSAQDLRPFAASALPCADLVPWARVMPGLRRHSDAHLETGIDWYRLMDRLARRDVPRRLPRRVDRRWPDPLVLVLDVCPRLDPYGEDFERLAMRLSSQLPSASLSVRTLAHGPTGGWRPWVHPKGAADGSRPVRRGEAAWQLPPGACVVLASDLGWFGGVQMRSIHQQWLAWGRQMRRQGVRVVVLAPVSTSLMTPEALQLFEVARWSPDSRWQRERRAEPPRPPAGGGQSAASASDSDEASDPHLALLLAMAAPAIRIDPPLLRAWRHLVAPGGDAGLEGRLWNHPHVSQQSLACCVRADALDQHLNSHSALPAGLRQAARAAMQADHAHLRRGVGITEALRADDDPADELALVKRLLHGLVPDSRLSAEDRAAQLRLAQFIQSNSISRVRALDPDLFSALDALLAQGPQAAQAPDVVPGEWQWRLRGDTLALQPSAFGMSGQIMAAPFLPGAARSVTLRAGRQWRSWPLTRDGVVLPLYDGLQGDVELAVGAHRWRLSQHRTPPWVEEVWVQAGAVFHAHTAPNGQRVDWVGDTDPAQVVVPSRLYVASDDYGLYADLTLAGRIPHSLRLRYIPPGQFLMGSHDGEGAHDEHPNHPVTLTEGYWFADTPCTQALWQAVMGANPSQFKDGPDAADRPVENVSWDDVQTFLQRLRKLLPPGCEPTLPTEAQWEYAARAGTSTAYWWGDEADDTRANWGQQHQSTTPVRQFTPNPWGLHDVHGNVWEWCLDDLREYIADPVRDPHGDLESSRRAVRGGSWFDRPDFARSAYRDGRRRGGASLDQGFRLSLRSPGPVPGAGGPGQGGGTGGPATGAGRPGAAGALFNRLAGGLSDAIGGLFGRKGGKKK